MAEQRKPGKKKVGFWLNDSERDLLRMFSEAVGLNQTDAFRSMLIDCAMRRGVIRERPETDIA